MKLFVCIYDDARLLTHFLAHYHAIGVSEFHIAAPPSLAASVQSFDADYRIRQYNELDVADSFLGGAAAVTGMRRAAHEPDEFALIADLDEFLEVDEPLERITEKMSGEGATVARGIMLDRFALDGRPKPFDDDSDLPELFPVAARFTKEVMKGFDQKGAIVKGSMESRVAHHTFKGEKVFSRIFPISHYKWNDRSLGRVQAAYDDLSRAGRPWTIEYQRILDHYCQNDRFDWESFGGEVVGRTGIQDYLAAKR